MVIPASRRPRMTPSTSPTSSGSSALVGSSNSITRGSSARDRAMATRCCCPPESCAGRWSPRSASPTWARAARPAASACARPIPATFRSANVTLPSAVMCGYRLNDWNTMPMRRRSRFRSVRRSIRSVPSTVMAPLSGVSSRFRQRSSVDLPEPDGPMTNTISPAATSRSTPRRTCSGPKCLWTPWAAIMRRQGQCSSCGAGS